ncbi:hypothetical protein JIN85_10305 [Luteolibacter pohnpeiensis]|uniref:Uncharacterized protein n=1 Tax=Luteolibacter pohnpeiensis TaxID=454153 RepID=A0A934S6L0_9BACT|nr:hypothetical protein [Luteolibacter pohnpeiensis]MBK1882808.1 hypothetical protein [Luteolibacter pohnpeiensis]
MSHPVAPDPPDAELQRLVSRFLDQCLTDAETKRLEQRLREEPAAQQYCAQCLRFDAAMQEVLEPQTLEWEETRRIVFDPKQGTPAWSIQREQTLRFGNPRRPLLSTAVRKRWPMFIIGGTLLAVAVGAIFFALGQSKSFQLRNGDFEAMDLSQSPSGRAKSILYWQDNFSTEDAQLQEIGRVSQGKIYAKSGRNVVRLENRAFINQLILNKFGKPLKAKPGLRVALTGWVYCEGGTEHHLRSSLRFVASGYPDMIQYEAAQTTIKVETGGWKKFQMELIVPDDLQAPPSDSSINFTQQPPPINLENRELSLSIDSRSPDAVLFLDDLSIEVYPPE